MKRTHRDFTPEEDALIQSKVYEQFGAYYIAKKLGRNCSSIMSRRRYLNGPRRKCRRCDAPILINRSFYCGDGCRDLARDEQRRAFAITPKCRARKAKYHIERMKDPAVREAKRLLDQKYKPRACLLNKVRKIAKAEGITVDEAYARFGVWRQIAKKSTVPGYYAGGFCGYCRKHSPDIDKRQRYCSSECSEAARRKSWRESKRAERMQQAEVSA